MSDKEHLIEDDEDDIEIIEIEEDQDDDNDGDDDRLESDQRDAQDEGGDGEETNARQLRRKRQKERQRENIKKTREENTVLLRELVEAKERLVALESRNVQSDSQTADQRYQYALQQIEAAELQLKEAFETGDGDKAIKAQRLREQSVRAAYEAEELKKKLNNPQLQKKSSVLDPMTENHAEQWMRKNPWFNPSGEDEDSAVARAIDEAWAREAQKSGVSPSSEHYWDELDARVKRRLGKVGVDRERRRAAPPVTGRGDSLRPSTSDNKVIVSPERKEALMKMNAWDDPLIRKRYLKAYRNYDRQNQR
jgi:hypothetical protein